MTFWNIFKNIALSDNGEVINRASDDTFIDQHGKVFIRNGSVITGTDGSLFNVLPDIGSKDGSSPGMAIKTWNGFDDKDDSL